ncbi:MAG TPA: T9SS type A sorting domain-containing protein [Calditrichaeota bacterium]|nr:T9SS type A sorting domain-containing protein [Calditrichota bacterium]
MKIPNKYLKNCIYRQRRLFAWTFLLMLINFNPGIAQDDLVLQNMEISGTETFEAKNSITAGPNFVITGSGWVTFKAGNFITLKPGVAIVSGGQFFAITGKINAIPEQQTAIPKRFELKQNFPNPFNPFTTINYELPRAGKIQLVIYNALGQVVKTLLNNEQNAGYHSIRFDMVGLASGVYIYTLFHNGLKVKSRKMILLQ